MDFTHLTKGDRVGRLFPGAAVLPMRVLYVDPTLVYCTHAPVPDAVAFAKYLIGTFDRTSALPF
jgi:hypothetical protein